MQIEINPKVSPYLETRAKETGESLDELTNEIILSYFVSDEYIIDLTVPLFHKIPSVKKVYLSGTNSIVVIQDENCEDRSKVYDVEQLLQTKIPARYFSFFTATNEANYSAYKKVYERRPHDPE